jgi:protein ImuB
VLWLALHFPLLLLEALPQRQSPSAVVARGRVLVGDGAAAAAGVRAGQKLSTALGLQPGLAVLERDEPRERQALQALACWAGRFTPTLSLAPPDALLLEIGGCLRLFGGAQAIVSEVLAGCAAQGYSAGWAAAPAPLGARWLARHGAAAVYAEATAMQAALAALPCSVPGWPDEVGRRLESFGLIRLGDLLRLPAAGLRRRIGNGPLDDLLRARGERPDPQPPFVFPERFAIDIDLPSRVEHAEALVFAGQRLFAALAGWLHGRQLLLRRCSLQLTHDDGPPCVLALDFAEPSADEGRFLRLLREHLSRLQLKAPVEALRLQADELVERPGSSGTLFAQAPAGEGALACLERLRARLGGQAVQALGQAADFRPECATRQFDVAVDAPRRSPPDSPSRAGGAIGQRPLWLLPRPQVLPERGGTPHWHGPLKLLSRAERLESGWWDEGEHGAAGDVRRDYFVARNPQGQWVWIFRDGEGWFLHGLFA